MNKIKLAYNIEVDIFDKGIADKIKELHKKHVEVIYGLIESDKPEPKKKEVFYETGQRFESEYGGEHKICLVGTYLATMISVDGRSCQTNPVHIDSADKITKEEFKKLCGEYGTFTLIADKK